MTLFILFFPLLSLSSFINPEAFMDFTTYCAALKYPVKSYWVTTEDGYILRVYRIGAKNSLAFNQAPPVFMQHGLIDASDDWIINEEDKAPGFLLANAGYDVWLGNTRGNRHSTNHTHMDPRVDSAFWDYSWQEMAHYDIPAEINLVLNKTGYDKLVYIGHSQGTTALLARLSEDPELHQKLYVAVLLAPVASLVRQKSFLITLLSRSGLVRLLKWLSIHQILDFKGNYILSYLCKVFPAPCAQGLYLFADMVTSEDNLARLPVIFGHYPSGASIQNMQHWMQMALEPAPVLQKLDYGSAQSNEEHYGTATAPVYDLSKVNGKLALFGGKNDRLADSSDVEWLRGQLTSAEILWFKNDYELGHGSFMWALDMSWFKHDVMGVIEEAVN